MSRAKLFQSLLNVAGPSLTSGALTTGVGLVTGDPLPVALTYGLADTLASGASLAALRKFHPQPKIKKTNLKTGKTQITQEESPFSLPVNFGASVLAGMGVTKLLGREQEYLQPTDTSQAQQVLQENIQRDILNSTLAGKFANLNSYSPGTMYQTQGIEHTLPAYAAMREGMHQMGGPSLGSIAQGMGAIVGV